MSGEPWRFNLWTYLNPLLRRSAISSRPVKEYAPWRAEWDSEENSLIPFCLKPLSTGLANDEETGAQPVAPPAPARPHLAAQPPARHPPRMRGSPRTRLAGALTAALALAPACIGTHPSRGEEKVVELAWASGLLGCIFGCNADEPMVAHGRAYLMVVNADEIPAFTVESDHPEVMSAARPDDPDSKASAWTL